MQENNMITMETNEKTNFKWLEKQSRNWLSQKVWYQWFYTNFMAQMLRVISEFQKSWMHTFVLLVEFISKRRERMDKIVFTMLVCKNTNCNKQLCTTQPEMAW